MAASARARQNRDDFEEGGGLQTSSHAGCPGLEKMEEPEAQKETAWPMGVPVAVTLSLTGLVTPYTAPYTENRLRNGDG